MTDRQAVTLPDDAWMVAWRPGESTAVEVGIWPDRSGWSRPYALVFGCCERSVLNEARIDPASAIGRTVRLLIEAEGLDPQAVHRELMKIAVHRELMKIAAYRQSWTAAAGSG